MSRPRRCKMFPRCSPAPDLGNKASVRVELSRTDIKRLLRMSGWIPLSDGTDRAAPRPGKRPSKLQEVALDGLAAVRFACQLREGREQRERDDRAQVAKVVAEFDGDAARMLEKTFILAPAHRATCRSGDQVRKSRTLHPHEPHWKPGERDPG
jgi:hypothetical protein